MYLEHFKFKELPFALTPNVDFFCQLKGHQEALNTILFSLQLGEGFIKIIGEVGSGKTLLCRKLLENLTNHYVTAYIPNPDLSPLELRYAFARELGIPLTSAQDSHELQALIMNQLLTLHGEGKKIVLLLDEAQALPVESIEALRLLTNLETKTTKLLQVVLFGQPELDEKIKLPELRQLKQRISFSYRLPTLSREDMDVYLFHRLAVAGNNRGALFSKQARNLLFKASAGIPRLVNILSHKSLLVAYGRGDAKISKKIMHLAIRDTEAVLPSYKKFLLFFALTLGSFVALLLYWYLQKGII